jgi:hypothetical protein
MPPTGKLLRCPSARAALLQPLVIASLAGGSYFTAIGLTGDPMPAVTLSG